MNVEQFLIMNGMGTVIKVQVTGDEQSLNWKQLMQTWFTMFEKVCSRFLNDSELTKLNQSPVDVVIQIHPILYDVLQAAFEYAIKTNFYFHPFVGTVMKNIGYADSFHKQGILREHKERASLFRVPSEKSLSFFPALKAVMKHTTEEIDLGGIGKGWSVDQAYHLLKDLGINAGIIDAGGDMLIWGDVGRKVGVTNPFNENEDIAQFFISSGAVATSNVLYRRWKINGETRHHIIHGRTGKNPNSDVVQATAFAECVTEAEVIAKVLCMLPSDEGIQWLKRNFPQSACMIVTQNSRLLITPSISRYVERMVM
ncbi:MULTISPECIES: FAD:protein FMN transferase [Anoxybacillus]|uniref:FAD:protein FMN transferase n=1 Tax=Anoxybacillus flavithermus TaxID=33934 RepID=A0A178TPA0_9BACL|nr:FAD:protein FMN transferase [Anoxybacillus flavithermus]ASA95495.1 thiamine biosynthesis protein ApbE [Anoxybacillus flavithermus]ELK22404.1 ApbE family lipoprotein [Anoxybacillus flavithermus TNO-09.006]MBE2905166.1 FAD:protein FMN transferase [Anoxybacillus flavithermus]MBE2907207.1 FAD:protein FMN transferase [Anoxybacillus flavithermus]MBE2909514.1 FAD:protein FMN transferase [Anoxybacillus flavithermus]